MAKNVTLNDISFCEVPVGSFIRGSSSTPEESPASEIELDHFLVSTTPITNIQYSRFFEQTGHRRPPLLDSGIFGEVDKPVVGVSWYDAMKYCEWLSSVIGTETLLPTEAQWEKSARGVDGRTYPWGNSPPNPKMLNIAKSVGCTTKVGIYGIKSPYGLLDLLGNVWEWCLDGYDPSYYSKAPQKNPLQNQKTKFKVIRGGSWRSDLFRATCSHRCYYHPNIRCDRVGFRIVINDKL